MAVTNRDPKAELPDAVGMPRFPPASKDKGGLSLEPPYVGLRQSFCVAPGPAGEMQSEKEGTFQCGAFGAASTRGKEIIRRPFASPVARDFR